MLHCGSQYIITNVHLYVWHDVSSSSEELYTKFSMVTNDMAQNDQNTLASSGEESYDFSNSFNKSWPTIDCHGHNC